MFADKNHIHAITTAIGTLGGFQAAPEWFNTLARTSVWNILMAAVLVYQGGGNLDFELLLTLAKDSTSCIVETVFILKIILLHQTVIVLEKTADL